MGFCKLDSGIVDSSVWSEPLSTRVLWVTMLAKSDSRGFVASSRSGLLRAANIPAEEFEKAIHTLEAPDPDSRTPDHEGRRIEKVKGGWVILNYAKYRAYSYSDSPEAIKQRRYREKEKERNALPSLPFDGNVSASASASASVSASQERGAGETPNWIPESIKGKAYEPAFRAFLNSRRSLLPLKGKPLDTPETIEQGIMPRLISIGGQNDEKRKRILEAAVTAKSLSLFDPDEKGNRLDGSQDAPAPKPLATKLFTAGPELQPDERPDDETFAEIEETQKKLAAGMAL